MSILAFVIAGVLIVIAALLFVPFGRSDSKRDEPRYTGPIFHDDSRYWYGIVYYNPDDPDVIIPKRYGFGWTVNFGHPMGKLIAVVLLIMLLLPLVIFLVSGGQATGCHTLGCTP